MAVALHVYKLDDDGAVSVEHIFYGETEAEARRVYDAHRNQCPALTEAFDDNDVAEEIEQDAVPPEIDEDDDEDEDQDEGDDEDESDGEDEDEDE